MTEAARTARDKTNLGGLVEAVRPGSIAAEIGLRPGDHVTAIDGHVLRDAIDVKFYASEDSIALEAVRNGTAFVLRVDKHPDEDLGITFATAAFDGIKVCNNSCFFCFLKGNPKGMRETLYVKDDDYRLSFFHGNFVTLTNLEEADWQRLEEQRLTPINVSVHATEPELRRYLLGNKTAPDICEQLARLGGIGILANTQVVLCPGVNDGAALDRTIRDLLALHPIVQTISVVPVGATMTAQLRIDRGAHADEINTCTPDYARSVVEQVAPYQRENRRRLAGTVVHLADEYYLTAGMQLPSPSWYDGYPQYENGVGMARALLEDWNKARRRGSPAKRSSQLGRLGSQGLVREHLYRGRRLTDATPSPGAGVGRVTFVCGTLIAPTLARLADEFTALTGIVARVHAVENRHFGPRVNVSGLLTATDIEESVRGQDLGDLCLLPRYTLDYTGSRFLDDRTPDELRQSLGVPIGFVSTMREVLQIVGEPLESDVRGATVGATTNGKSWVDYTAGREVVTSES